MSVISVTLLAGPVAVRTSPHTTSAVAFIYVEKKIDTLFCKKNSINTVIMNSWVYVICGGVAIFVMAMLFNIPMLPSALAAFAVAAYIWKNASVNVQGGGAGGGPVPQFAKEINSATLWTKECGGGGDCFYYSVADDLARKGKAFVTMEELRDAAANYVNNLPEADIDEILEPTLLILASGLSLDDLKAANQGPVYTEKQHLVDGIKRRGKYVDEITLNLVARYLFETYKLGIMVVESAKQKVFPPPIHKRVIVKPEMPGDIPALVAEEANAKALLADFIWVYHVGEHYIAISRGQDNISKEKNWSKRPPGGWHQMLQSEKLQYTVRWGKKGTPETGWSKWDYNNYQMTFKNFMPQIDKVVTNRINQMFSASKKPTPNLKEPRWRTVLVALYSMIYYLMNVKKTGKSLNMDVEGTLLEITPGEFNGTFNFVVNDTDFIFKATSDSNFYSKPKTFTFTMERDELEAFITMLVSMS